MRGSVCGSGARLFQEQKTMNTTLLVILIAIVLVGFFVVAMSLTLMIKGHNIDSEISENKHMRDRGIKCAVQETHELDAEMAGKKAACNDATVCGGNCSSCVS